MPRQLRLPMEWGRQRRRRRKLRRPQRDGPRCQNMLQRRRREGGHYVKLPSEQCAHRGRRYMVNGFEMVLCVCCARKLVEKNHLCVLREARKSRG